MTKSKKSKSKSETLIKSSDRSHAVAKGNKKGLTKKSSGNTIPGTSNSVFSTRNSEANPSYHEKTLSIQKYSHESIHRVRSKQHPKSSHLIVPQNHRKVTKKRSHQHANDSNLYSDKVISFVKSSENVQIIDDREDAQDEISQVSLISNLENGFFIDANLSKTFDDHHEHHEHHEHPKTSSHKKASQDSILKKSKLSQESVRIPLIQATESFHINKLKRRPKPVPEIQSETRDDSIISVRTENEPSVLVAENTSQTSDNEDVEVNNNMKFLSQLRDFPNWNEHYKQALLDLTEEVEEDKPEDISVKPGDPLAATSTDLNLAKEDTETDQDGLYEAQPSQLKLCGHSLAEVSTSEIEESDSFDDADDADDADDDDDDLNLSDQFPEEYQAPFKNTNFVLDSDEVDVVVNKLGPFELNGMVYDFLDEIICKVVGIAAKPERILSQILDKDKLMDTLLDEANEHRMEKFIHQNLSKRITDILVRQCKYSLVTPSRSSNMNENNYSRCISALNELDYWLKREKLSIKTARKEVKRLAVEENTMRTEDDNLWQRLEDLINNTVLNRPNASDNLKMFTGNIIRRLKNMRDELSETRLNLILKQHTYSQIKTKIDKMDIIAENLTMHKYMSVEAQVENLNRTLESRNLSVIKTSNLINSKIHTVSHLRCRRKTLSRKLRAAKVVLESLRSKFKALRFKAYRCNKMHNRLFSELGDVRHQGGIMLYPLLITDYDHTIDDLARKRSEIEALRAQHDKLIRRITPIEEARRISQENRNQARYQLRTSTLVERMEKR